MKLLALETATLMGGVAVSEGERILASLRLGIKVAHSERLMPSIRYCLGQAGLDIKDIDVLAVSIGPGSFTGLRVGLSTAKGLAFARGNLPIVAVPTLEAMAWQLPLCSLPVCPLLDARKGELYGAVFQWGPEGFKRLKEETTLRPQQWAQELSRLKEVVLQGEGAWLYRGVLGSLLGRRAVFAPGHAMQPSAASVAVLGYRMAREGIFSEPMALAPQYIRKSEAELKMP
jgi:tRNA threonylcarbamoyladenosine biosynthesis protein TsaB